MLADKRAFCLSPKVIPRPQIGDESARLLYVCGRRNHGDEWQCATADGIDYGHRHRETHSRRTASPRPFHKMVGRTERHTPAQNPAHHEAGIYWYIRLIQDLHRLGRGLLLSSFTRTPFLRPSPQREWQRLNDTVLDVGMAEKIWTGSVDSAMLTRTWVEVVSRAG